MDEPLMYLLCAVLVGLGGWIFSHTVDRRVHVDSASLVSEEVLKAKLAGLEDRLGGRIMAVSVKLEDMEKLQRVVYRNLEQRMSGK